MCFPHSSVGKESPCNARDPGSIPGSERSAGEGIYYPLQYSWASFVAQLGKHLPAMQKTWVQHLGWEDPWRREQLPIPVFWPGEFHGLYSPWVWVTKRWTWLNDLLFFSVLIDLFSPLTYGQVLNCWFHDQSFEILSVHRLFYRRWAQFIIYRKTTSFVHWQTIYIRLALKTAKIPVHYTNCSWVCVAQS